MFPVTSRYQAPNITSIAQQTEKEILFGALPTLLKQPAQIASGFPHVDVGDVLGMVTATSKYRRVTRARTSGSHGAVTLIHLSEPSPFIVGDIVNVGSDNTHTITAVDNGAAPGVYTITLGSALGSGPVATNSAVVLSTPDGSETAVGIAGHPAFAAAFDPAKPNANFLLDLDYTTDLILMGSLVKTKLRGLDATSITSLGGLDLSPYYDAIIIR